MMYVSLFFAAFLAFALSAFCGGGAGLLLIPILGYCLPVSQVPAALTLGTAVSSLSRIWLFFSAIRWDLARVFLPPALLGVVLGAKMLSYLQPMYLELCMGLFLVGNLPWLFRKPAQSHAAAAPPVPCWRVRLVGFAAGFISGLTGAVGVLFNRFYFRYGLSSHEIVATRAANEVLLHLIKLYLYAAMGLFQLKTLETGLLVALAAVAASTAMKYVLPRVSKGLFMRAGYAAMVVTGVVMLNSALVHIRLANQPGLRVSILAGEFDASLTWNTLVYSLEFNYGEGLEFEKVVPIATLSAAQLRQVQAAQDGADKVIIEKVYALTASTYEADFYDAQNHWLKQIEFD